jgi:hypothetical protein
MKNTIHVSLECVSTNNGMYVSRRTVWGAYGVRSLYSEGSTTYWKNKFDINNMIQISVRIDYCKT